VSRIAELLRSEYVFERLDDLDQWAVGKHKQLADHEERLDTLEQNPSKASPALAVSEANLQRLSANCEELTRTINKMERTIARYAGGAVVVSAIIGWLLNWLLRR
jgi:chromosome segregation ATPase